MIQTGNVVVRNLQGSFKHINCLFIFFSVLVGETLGVVKLGIGRHYLDSEVKVFMSIFYFLQGKVSIASVEKSAGIVGVKR